MNLVKKRPGSSEHFRRGIYYIHGRFPPVLENWKEVLTTRVAILNRSELSTEMIGLYYNKI